MAKLSDILEDEVWLRCVLDPLLDPGIYLDGEPVMNIEREAEVIQPITDEPAKNHHWSIRT